MEFTDSGLTVDLEEQNISGSSSEPGTGTDTSVSELNLSRRTSSDGEVRYEYKPASALSDSTDSLADYLKDLEASMKFESPDKWLSADKWMFIPGGNGEQIEQEEEGEEEMSDNEGEEEEDEGGEEDEGEVPGEIEDDAEEDERKVSGEIEPYRYLTDSSADDGDADDIDDDVIEPAVPDSYTDDHSLLHSGSFVKALPTGRFSDNQFSMAAKLMNFQLSPKCLPVQPNTPKQNSDFSKHSNKVAQSSGKSPNHLLCVGPVGPEPVLLEVSSNEIGVATNTGHSTKGHRVQRSVNETTVYQSSGADLNAAWHSQQTLANPADEIKKTSSFSFRDLCFRKKSDSMKSTPAGAGLRDRNPTSNVYVPEIDTKAETVLIHRNVRKDQSKVKNHGSGLEHVNESSTESRDVKGSVSTKGFADSEKERNRYTEKRQRPVDSGRERSCSGGTSKYLPDMVMTSVTGEVSSCPEKMSKRSVDAASLRKTSIDVSLATNCE